MPQLEISTFTSQIFWLFVSFFSMMFIMSKFIIPKIAEVMERRQKKIDNYLNKASHFKQEAEATLQKYQEALSKATQSANKALSENQAEINKIISDKQNELSKHLQKKIQEGEAEINSGKEQALKEIKTISEKLALEVVKKIGITDIQASDIKVAVKNINH